MNTAMKFRQIRIVTLLCAFFFAMAGPTAQGRPLSEDALLDRGINAYNQLDFITALMYLYAYKERNPLLMRQNATFARDVNTAIDYSREHLERQLRQLSQLRNRLARRNDDGIGSSVSGLTVAPPPLSRPLATPHPLSPADGRVFDHYPRRTTLSWRPVQGAQSYSVEIDCFHCCSSGKWCTEVGRNFKIVNGINSTRYTFDFVGAQPGRWRVWAVDRQGRPGPKSDWQDFRYSR